MCWHAAAVKHFTLADEQWAASICADHVYEHIDEVKLRHDAVTLISGNSLCRADLVLSVCTSDSGWPRTVVGADSSGSLLCRNPACCSRPGLKYKCQHCKAVDQWLSGIEAEVSMLEQTADNPERLEVLSALAAETKGLSLRQHQQTAAVNSSATPAPNFKF